MFIIDTGISTEGLAFGTAFLYTQEQNTASYKSSGNVEGELERFRNAVEAAKTELEALAADEEIFAAHLEMADDPMLAEEVENLLNEEQANGEEADAVRAVCAAGEAISGMLAALDDEYLSGRADDVMDVCRRITDKLLGGTEDKNILSDLPENSIIVAKELAPSDTAKMNFDRISAFVSEGGSRTSHVCIIARNKGIVAVVGTSGAMERIQNGDRLIVDGEKGLVIINPDSNTENEYAELRAEKLKGKAEDEALAHEAAIRSNGKRIPVFGNAGNHADIAQAIAAGADGIGLFRSEFLYMESGDFPDEEAQFAAYRNAAELCGERPLIIRTLDIGGDKSLPYMPFDKENNPFLGWRAIRISLKMREMFHTQLRALLRASVYGNLRIMFPMIATLSELRAAKAEVEICKNALRNEGRAFNENIKLGMMIETPAAVMIADLLGQECDFFSIGTNDLTQYIMAADRDNPKVAYLCDPHDEAVKRSISHIVEAAHKCGIEVGMCGEFASDPKACAFLLDCGLDAFSVNAHAVASVKSRIRLL